MVEPEAVTTLLRLRALGWGSKRIARELGLSRGTVKRYVDAGGWQPFKRPRRSKLLDGLDDWLRDRFRRHRGNADVVRQELATEKGIVASLRTVQRAVEPYRQELLAEARATVRFETARGRPRTAAVRQGRLRSKTATGRQLQIDFGCHPERQAARGPRASGWSRSPGARSRCSCSSRRSAIRVGYTFAHSITSGRRAGSTAWRARSWLLAGCRRRCCSTMLVPWSSSMMPRAGRSSSMRSSWPLPGIGASGRALAHHTGHGPRARPRGVSATSSGTPSPAAALPAGKHSRRIWRAGNVTSPMLGCTARPAKRRWSASHATRRRPCSHAATGRRFEPAEPWSGGCATTVRSRSTATPIPSPSAACWPRLLRRSDRRPPGL